MFHGTSRDRRSLEGRLQLTFIDPDRPVVVHPDAYSEALRALEENKDSPLLNKALVLSRLSSYGAPAIDLRLSPLLAPLHAGLPPAYIQVHELDPLRDDGMVYVKLLREAGIQTQLVQYKGTVHGFHYSFPGIAATAKLDKDERDGLRWLLSSSRGDGSYA